MTLKCFVIFRIELIALQTGPTIVQNPKVMVNDFCFSLSKKDKKSAKVIYQFLENEEQIHTNPVSKTLIRGQEYINCLGEQEVGGELFQRSNRILFTNVLIRGSCCFQNDLRAGYSSSANWTCSFLSSALFTHLWTGNFLHYLIT